jgi:hypothetical protein
MREVIARNAKNEERIFPYLGGDEINIHLYMKIGDGSSSSPACHLKKPLLGLSC